jgi:hypothetical protein
MQPEQRAPDRATREDDEIVPLFGSWRNAYLAVVLAALAALGAIAVFQAWSF